MKDKIISALIAFSLITLYIALRVQGMSADEAKIFIDTILISAGKAMGMSPEEAARLIRKT